MKPGDPFETKAMDELRSTQRRALRLVPDWLLSIYAPAQNIDVGGVASPGLVEQELRDLAQEILAELGDLLDRMEQHTRTDVRSNWVQQWGSDVSLKFGVRRAPEPVFSSKIAELQQRAAQVRIGQEPEPEVAAALARYVHLLVWADQLARDGYTDPRLASHMLGANAATVIRGILDDLDLTPEQRAREREVCRRHLAAASEEATPSE